MRKKLFLMITGLAILMCMAISVGNVSASVNKALDINLDYGIDVGDSFVYRSSMRGSEWSINGSESQEKIDYAKLTIVNTTVFNGGVNANLTYNTQHWNSDYNFDTDLIEAGLYWSPSFEEVMIINNTMRSIFFSQQLFALPVDVTLEDIASGDMIDVMIYFMMSGIDGREGLKNEAEMMLPLEDSSFDDNLQIDIDPKYPYARVIYTFDISGINSTMNIEVDMGIRIELQFKLNEYGILEEVLYQFDNSIYVENINTHEIYTDNNIEMHLYYKLLWSSNDKYMTPDYIPVWEREPSWFAQNWRWILLGISTIVITAFITYYINVRANCNKLIDKKHEWVCGTPNK